MKTAELRRLLEEPERGNSMQLLAAIPALLDVVEAAEAIRERRYDYDTWAALDAALKRLDAM